MIPAYVFDIDGTLASGDVLEVIAAYRNLEEYKL